MDDVVRILASKQQIWSGEVGYPRGNDSIEVVVCRERVDVWVQLFVVCRRCGGDSRSTRSYERGREDG